MDFRGAHQKYLIHKKEDTEKSKLKEKLKMATKAKKTINVKNDLKIQLQDNALISATSTELILIFQINRIDIDI